MKSTNFFLLYSNVRSNQNLLTERNDFEKRKEKNELKISFFFLFILVVVEL